MAKTKYGFEILVSLHRITAADVWDNMDLVTVQACGFDLLMIISVV